MRLIDAVALRKAMYHEAMEKDSDESKWESGCWIRYRMFERVLKTQPTIDPVKRGRWELAEDGWYCSACELYPPFDCDPEEKGIPFCPWCGARMDVPDTNVGETKGEENED